MSDLRDEVTEGFTSVFGYAPHGLWSAPGGVRLLGDHTEYSDGHTLTVAVNRRVVVGLGVRKDRRVRVASAVADELAEIPLDELESEELVGWTAYPLGVLRELGRLGTDLQAVPGLDLFIESDVPDGMGIGASTALSAAVALAVNDAWQAGHDRMALARVCALVEAEVTGEPTGLGLAVASLRATEDHATLVDARSRDVEMIPLHFTDHEVAILLVHTDDSPPEMARFQDRLSSLERVADLLDAGSLRDVSEKAFEGDPRLASVDATTLARARHVVSENKRVLEAVQKIRTEGPDALADLFLQAHRSVSTAFGVGTPGADLAVETAIEQGAFAARLLGHRSTGTVVVLCPEATVSRIVSALDGAFSEHALPIPDTVVCQVGPGAARL